MLYLGDSQNIWGLKPFGSKKLSFENSQCHMSWCLSRNAGDKLGITEEILEYGGLLLELFNQLFQFNSERASPTILNVI